MGWAVTFIYEMTDEVSPADVGGKAAALVNLAAHGFDVPSFFILGADAFTPSGLKAQAKRDLIVALKGFEGGPVAVRSSGRDEDGVEHSHAGQFLTVLNVAPQHIPREAHKVWKSGDTENIRSYRASKGLSNADPHPAVLIQTMIAPRCAGVAFTADPVTGQRDKIVISAVAGLAEALVNGDVDGETYQVINGSVIGPEKGVLSPQDVEKLITLCEVIESHFGTPQDIEWAFDDARLYVLQSRPITTPLRGATLPDTQPIVFDNSNIIESYPGLVTPLTYSFAQYAYARVYREFVALLGVKPVVIRENSAVFDNMLARIDGRVYYNLLNWYRALAFLPGFSTNRDHMEGMMGVDLPLPPEIAATIGPPPATGLKKIGETLSLFKIAGRLMFESIRLPRTRAAFIARLNLVLESGEDGLNEMPLSALAAEYRRIEADVLDRWDAPLINDFICMIAFGLSRKLMEKWAGEAGLMAHNEILIGQGDIISAEPAQRIRRMGVLVSSHRNLKAQLAMGDGASLSEVPELQAEIQSYLNKFKDRCTEELKLESVTLDRDPSQIYRAIAAAADRPKVSKSDSLEQEGLKIDQLKIAFKGKPFRKSIVRPLLVWARNRVRDRENLRFERTRVFGRARRIFLAIAAHFHAASVIDEIDDIFFLSVHEVLGAIEGFATSPDLKSVIALRKAEFERDSLKPDRASRFTIEGAMVTGLDEMKTEALASLSGDTQMATGCSLGVVTAKARVVTDPRTQSLKQGDILVAHHTDPGWIAVFTNASAIVVERGSLLSHSAIVARELGIPCVVGLKGATTWIEDGDTLCVDGAKGRVEIVRP